VWVIPFFFLFPFSHETIISEFINLERVVDVYHQKPVGSHSVNRDMGRKKEAGDQEASYCPNL